jgi:hypothetical protein
MPLTHREDKPSVLARCRRLIHRTPTWEQELPWFPPALPQIVVERLPGDLGQLEPIGLAGLAFGDVGPVNGIAVRRHVIRAQGGEIATTQLAADRKVEHGQVARATLELRQLRPDYHTRPGRNGVSDP